MAALIGLLVGALAGHAVWGKWGAIVGGLAGFFAGAMFLGKRAREVYRKPGALVAGAPVAATAAGDATLIERVAKLEARIAVLERAQGQVAPGRRVAGDRRERRRAAQRTAGNPRERCCAARRRDAGAGRPRC